MFTLPAVVLYCIFFVSPVLSGIFYSFTDWNGITRKYSFIGFSNYLKLFGDSRLKNSLTFNFKYVLILVTVILFFSFLLALLLNSNIRFRTMFRSFYFFPAVLSLITVGLIWNEILYRAIPVIGKYFGIEFLSSNILSSPKTAIFGIAIVHIWQGTAIPTVLLLAGLQSIPKDLYEAATIDGANIFQKVINITVPLLLPIFNVVIVLVLKSGLTVFDYISALTDGGPAGATESIAYLIYNEAFIEMKFSYAITQSLIIFIIIAIASTIQFKIFNTHERGSA